MPEILQVPKEAEVRAIQSGRTVLLRYECKYFQVIPQEVPSSTPAAEGAVGVNVDMAEELESKDGDWEMIGKCAADAEPGGDAPTPPQDTLTEVQGHLDPVSQRQATGVLPSKVSIPPASREVPTQRRARPSPSPAKTIDD
eukprot:UN08095